MDIFSLLTLPFKLIWAVLSFPFKLVLTGFGFLTHWTWAVLSFPFKLVLTLVGAITHGFIGTFMALILFFASPFGFFSPQQHSIDPSPTLSASTFSPQTVMTTYGSSSVATGNDLLFFQKLNEYLPEELLGLFGGIPDSSKIEAAQFACKTLKKGGSLTDLNLLGMKINHSSVSSQKYISALMLAGVETYCPQTEYQYQAGMVRINANNL